MDRTEKVVRNKELVKFKTISPLLWMHHVLFLPFQKCLSVFLSVLAGFRNSGITSIINTENGSHYEQSNQPCGAIKFCLM